MWQCLALLISLVMGLQVWRVDGRTCRAQTGDFALHDKHCCRRGLSSLLDLWQQAARLMPQALTNSHESVQRSSFLASLGIFRDALATPATVVLAGAHFLWSVGAPAR